MTSAKQITANRRNALRSKGPRTDEGKRRSRCNAVRHGLTAETVIVALENAGDYRTFEASIASDYHTRSATDHELVARLASVLWRLRRSTSIETGLFQIQGELMRNQNAVGRERKTTKSLELYGEFDVGAQTVEESINYPLGDSHVEEDAESAKVLASCFLRASRLQYGGFDLLTRYETALWRQAAQLLFMLQSAVSR